jgi:hypothetical protein
MSEGGLVGWVIYFLSKVLLLVKDWRTFSHANLNFVFEVKCHRDSTPTQPTCHEKSLEF